MQQILAVMVHPQLLTVLPIQDQDNLFVKVIYRVLGIQEPHVLDLTTKVVWGRVLALRGVALIRMHVAVVMSIPVLQITRRMAVRVPGPEQTVVLLMKVLVVVILVVVVL